MQVTETKNEGLLRGFKVIVPGAGVQEGIENELQEVAKTAKMAGFRPGRVPMQIVRKKYGQEVLSKVLEKTIADSSQKVLEERDLQPSLQPKIDITSFEHGQDLEFVIDLEVLPKVPEVDIADLEIEKSKVIANDNDVAEGLERLKNANMVYTPIAEDRAAKEGDALLIDYVGRVDGQEFTGGSAQDHNLILGSKTFIPGFEDQLIGAKKGEVKDVNVVFPENYHQADLKAKPAIFTVTVKEINQSSLPEENEEFAKKFGFDTMDRLKEEIKGQIEKDYEFVARTKLKKELFDKLDVQFNFDVPSNMLEMEKKNLDNTKNMILENKEKKVTEQEAEEKVNVLAIRRIKLGLILAELSKKFSIEVTNEELRKAVFEQARAYQGQEQQIIEYYQKNPAALEQLKGPILEEKVVDYILDNAKVVEKDISIQDLLKFNEMNDLI